MRTTLWLPAALVLLVIVIVGGIILLPSETFLITDQDTVSNIDSDDSQTGMDSPQEIDSNAADTQNQGNGGIESATTPKEKITSSEIKISMATDSQSSSDSSQNNGPSNNPNAPPNQTNSKTLQGVVHNTNGQPLSDATVSIAEQNPIVTSSNGNFSFTGLQTETVMIQAKKEGYQTLEKNAKVGTLNLELVMVKEGALAGRVLDQNNEPVAFAKVEINSRTGIWMRNFTADREGRFVVENAPDTKVHMKASMDGYQARGQEQAEVDSPHPSEVILRLYLPSFSISGRVLNRQNDQPVSGFSLMAKPETGDESDNQTTTSQGNGMYSFENLKRGIYIVSSIVEQNSQKNLVVPIDQDNKNVRIYENSAHNVDFYVEAGREISGRVQTSEGQPIGNAKVSVAKLGAPQTFSGSDGTYRLSGVPILSPNAVSSKNAIRIYAEHENYGTGVSDPLPNNSELAVSGITIIMQSAASVSGQVVDTNDAAVANARVLLSDNITGKVQETQTGPAGSFTFSEVPTSSEALSLVQGTHTIEAIKENFGSAQRQLVVQSGSQENVTLTIEAGGRIAGRAVDDQGNIVQGARVTTWLNGGQQVHAQTDANGFYEFSALPAGTYDLLFRLDGNPPMIGNLYAVQPGRTDANAVMSPNEWIITGTLIDKQTGQLINQFEIQLQADLQSAEGRGYSKTQNFNSPDGTYQISVYDEGLYTLTYYAEGYRPEQGRVRTGLPNRGRQFVNIQMEPVERFGELRGMLQPPPGKQLVAVRVGGKDIYPTNGNSFHIQQVPEGNHQLYFYISDAGGGVGYEMAGALEVTISANQIKNIGTITPNQLIFIRQ